MTSAIHSLTDWLYSLWVWISGIMLILITTIIPWLIYTRYAVKSAALPPWAKDGRWYQSLTSAVRTVMSMLYWLCVWIAGTALVLISAIIPWAVYTRYELNSAASWPEPTAVLLMIVLTFFGAAACYRVGLHMRMSFFASLLPPHGQRLCALLVELLMALIAIFMVRWGITLVVATWQNSVADFPSLSVGVTYLPIPLGGAILLLFVIERLTIGPPAQPTREESAAFE
jgi:TRAP-type C4-dicarboxylate transport system permease small subunit